MLNHSISVSEKEEELGFAIHNLPSTEGWASWDGKFEMICARLIDASCYVMKFEEQSGPEYYQFKWGIPKSFPKAEPKWIPAGQLFADPEMAIQAASVDLADYLDVEACPLPMPRPSK